MHDPFVDLFWRSFAEIPEKDQVVIRKYWEDCKVKPEIYLDSVETKSKTKGRILACVTGRYSLHKFYFRDIVVKNAPLKIQVSIIKHELAHCYDFGMKPRRSKPSLNILPPRISLSQHEDIISKSFSLLNEISRSELDEPAAIRKNKEWGSDEDAIDVWAAGALPS